MERKLKQQVGVTNIVPLEEKTSSVTTWKMSSCMLKELATAFWVTERHYKPCLIVTLGALVQNLVKRKPANPWLLVFRGVQKSHQALGIRRRVPCVSLELPALPVGVLRLVPHPVPPAARTGHSPLEHNREIPGKWGWKDPFLFNRWLWSPGEQGPASHRWTFPLSLLGENFRRLQEQIWGGWANPQILMLPDCQAVQNWTEPPLERSHRGTYPASAIIPGNSSFGPFGKF